MSFNITGSPKTFGDVREGEKIYILDPKDQSIKEVTVVKSHIHPHSRNRAVWVIEIYIPFRLKSIKDESLKAAKEYGTKVTQQVFVEIRDHIVVLMTEIPTVIATESKYISQWMAKEKSNLILPRRNV